MTIVVTYSEGQDVAAAIDRVFDYRLDYTNLAAYNPNVSNVRRVDGGSEPGPGARYEFDLTIPGMGEMVAFLQVIEAERPMRIVQDTGSEALYGREVCSFTALPDGRTRVEFAFEMSLPDEAKDGVAFMEQSGREQFRVELDLMKKVLEGAA